MGGAHSYGLLARISPIAGITPKRVLDKPFWLPAILDPFRISDIASHTEYDTIGAGQFSQAPAGRDSKQLRTIDSMNSLIMWWDPSWIVYSGQNPIHVRFQLLGVLDSRKPVRLLVTWNPNPDRWPPVDMHVTLRQIDREVRPGENDTTYLTLSIKEWRDPRVAQAGHRPPPHRPKLPTTVRLKMSDTLWSLSKQWYGTYSHWQLIRDTNGISKRWGAKTPIVRLHGRWKVGAKIKIPVLPAPKPKAAKR